MRIQLEIAGDVQLSRTLLRFRQHAEDMSPAFEQIADDFYEIERRQFASEGVYGSGGWKPLSPGYAARKSVLYPGKPILQATGALFESLTGGRGAVKKVSRDELLLSTDDEKAPFHQRGTRKMPQRRPVELRSQDRKNMVKVLQRYLVSGETRGGMFGIAL